MKTIELVTHCYAAELPHYAGALCYQLNSLLLYKPQRCEVAVTVCMATDDPRALEVVDFFRERVKVREIFLPRNQIGRRCIGRNMAAKWTEADIVWFADCDQVYRNGILDRLAEMEWPNGAAMIYPKQIMIHRDHETGDVATDRIEISELYYGAATEPYLPDLDPSEFIPKRYNRAIGGVQIVKGDFAREHGYLDGDPKWQRPRTDGKPFADFRDDIAYRKFCNRHGEIVGVDLPGMYRIRHTRKTHPD